MIQSFKLGIRESFVHSVSSFLAGILLNFLYIFGIVGREIFFIMLILSIITTLVITVIVVKSGFLYLLGWIVGIFIAYLFGLINEFSFLLFISFPIVGFLMGITIKIGIFLLKLLILILLGSIAFLLVLSLFI
ncbi:hypothetical protein BA065_02035 [Nanoarchaeota archaeon NZ13-N]|uniref:Uncharacterized protein n=1 Tax=Candidatus Nanoclepta minutus TaxID=1940235 RepID=A0A397WM62_9ARCH|nr:MAG: hypothetical protein BA065_02035 [Nanoarchaeota archaeon NZ13-N]RIB35118.1 MAG: hypothetical protein BXU00_03245 [Candidatus Nanoclepta minutus]